MKRLNNPNRQENCLTCADLYLTLSLLIHKITNVLSVTVISIRNEIDNQSSNPRRDCVFFFFFVVFVFVFANALGKGMIRSVLSVAMGK